MKALPLTLVLASFLGTSCGFAPQSVTLRPKVELAATTLGQSRTVGVTVVDERARSIVGYRATAAPQYGGLGGAITTAGDPSSAVQAALADGLRRHGFNPLTGPTQITQGTQTTLEGRDLRVEIRGLDYNANQVPFAYQVRVEATLKGICVVGSARPYERTYRGEYEENIFMVMPTDSANEEYLNLVLSRAIQRLLEDTELIQCLAR